MLDDIRKNTYKIRWSKSVVLLIHCVGFFFFQHFVRQSFSYKQANICNNSYEINASLLYHKAVIEYLEESKVQIDRLLSYL